MLCSRGRETENTYVAQRDTRRIQYQMKTSLVHEELWKLVHFVARNANIHYSQFEILIRDFIFTNALTRKIAASSQLLDFRHRVFALPVTEPGIPIKGISTARHTQSKPPKVIPMRKEQLPELKACGYAPGWLILVTACNAVRIFVAVAVSDIGDGGRECVLRDEDLLTMHGIAPF